MAEIIAPFGEAVKVELLGDQAETTIEVKNSMIIIDGATKKGELTRTLTLDTSSVELRPGFMILVSHQSNTGAENIAFGEGFQALDLVGPGGGKTVNQMFMYNGIEFVPTGEKIQIN